jgi:hypothetical protein
MKKIAVLLSILMVVLGAPEAFAANSLAVTNAAAMGPEDGGQCSGGPCGLAVTMDGSTNPARVQDDSPNNEAIYRASFWFDPTGLTMAETDYFVIARWTETSAVVGSAMLLMVYKNGNYRLFARAANNAAGVFRFTSRINLTGANRIQIEWTQSPAPATPGGDMVVTILEGPQAGATVAISDIQGLNNSARDIDNAMIGAVGNLANAPGTSGTMYFDTFESFRTLAP